MENTPGRASSEPKRATARWTRRVLEGLGAAIGVILAGPVLAAILSILLTGIFLAGCCALLVVGSPTRAFSPTPKTRRFVGSIPSLQGVKVAAFDTRIALSDVDSRILPVFVRVFGYAAKPIADRLTKKGGDLVIAPEGFFVEGTEGPLKDGELERAADWARQIMVMATR